MIFIKHVLSQALLFALIAMLVGWVCDLWTYDTNATIGSIFGLVIGSFLDTDEWKKKQSLAKFIRELEKDELEQISKIKSNHRSDFVKKPNLVEKGWVKVDTQESREDVERELEILAGRLGDNAIVNFYWYRETEKYIAGYGHRGNPYYQNKSIFKGEGLAVSVSDKKPTPKSSPIHSPFLHQARWMIVSLLKQKPHELEHKTIKLDVK